MKKNALIVDDSPFVREMVGRIVVELGHLATKAADGDAALRIVAHQEPDVFILDVRMPGMDGLSVLRELRRDERFTSKPIVMLTSVGDNDIVRECIKSKASGYILKDVPEEIARRLKQFLDRPTRSV